MRLYVPSLVVLTAALLLLNVQRSRVHAAPTPVAQDVLPVRIVGEALKTSLPRLGKEYGLSLEAGRELADQRVTLYGRRLPSRVWTEGLRELLSASAEAPVRWARAGADRPLRLEQSQHRRELVARLLNMDQEAYARYLDERIAWARTEGRTLLAEAQGPFRGPAVDQVVSAGIIESLGEDGRARLMAGEPLVVFFGRFRGTPLEDLVQEWVGIRFPGIAKLDPAERDRCSLVLTRERHPFDPLNGGITESVVRPTGFMSAIGPMTSLRIPHQRWGRHHFERLSDPLAEEPADARKLTLNLAPLPGAKPGQTVLRNLDQILETLAREAELTVIADGYLRPSQLLPANLTARDVPLERLLTRLAAAWDCEWRYAEKDRSVVLVRAKYWWLEDLADVPQPQLEDLLPRFRGDRPVELEDLLRLAELREAQIRKLTENYELCPAANGLFSRATYAGIGAGPCLQFYSRLPEALQRRARSPEGLPLAEAGASLTQTWLYRTVVACAGGVSPEIRGNLVFQLTALPPERPGAPSPGYQVRIRSAAPPGPNWFEDIKLPNDFALKRGLNMQPAQ
jgi:hypothetical protein